MRKLVVAMVKPDVTDKVVQAGKKVGGAGATIVPARGTGVHEAKTFFGLVLEEQTDVILFLMDDGKVDSVLKAISEAGRFEEPGTGIAFVVPVEQAVGMVNSLHEG